MKVNISSLNRLIRVLLGSGLLITTAFFLVPLNIWVLGLGLILVSTGLIGFCPMHYYWRVKRQPE